MRIFEELSGLKSAPLGWGRSKPFGAVGRRFDILMYIGHYKDSLTSLPHIC